MNDKRWLSRGGNKFAHVQPCETADGHFDSKWELEVFQELKKLPGWTIERQVKIELLPASEFFPAKSYVCDFVLKHPRANGLNIYVEAKGEWAFTNSESCGYLKFQLQALAINQPKVFRNLIVVTRYRLRIPGWSRYALCPLKELVAGVKQVAYNNLLELKEETDMEVKNALSQLK